MLDVFSMLNIQLKDVCFKKSSTDLFTLSIYFLNAHIEMSACMQQLISTNLFLYIKCVMKVNKSVF